MKAAQLYAYDEEMNVDLKIETVPEPTISDPEDVIVRVGAAGLVPYRFAHYRRGMAGCDGCRRRIVTLHHGT